MSSLGDDRGISALGVYAPDDEPGVVQVMQHLLDGRVGPLAALGCGNAVGIESVSGVGDRASGGGFAEDAAHDVVVGRVRDKGVVKGSAAVLLDFLDLISVGRVVAGVVSSQRHLALAAADVLAQVGRVEGVHALDHVFHHLTGWGVVDGFFDGNDPDAVFLEPVLVDGVVELVP